MIATSPPAVSGVVIDPATSVAPPPKSSIQIRFERFHAKNPRVYEELVKLARRAKRRNVRLMSIDVLFGVVRWRDTFRDATQSPDGSGYKLNNDYTSHYARLIMAQEPDLAGMFEIRALRSR